MDTLFAILSTWNYMHILSLCVFVSFALAKLGGNVGVIHNIETDEDLTWIVDYGPNAPYIVIMSSLIFNM